MSKNINACLSHDTDHWRTPSKLYKAFMDLGAIDPCPYMSNEDNFMKLYKDSIIFINPPFSELKKWLFYAQYLACFGNQVFILMPVRTDTKYFKDLFYSHKLDHIYFLEGRLHFNDSNAAPFPSMILELSEYNDLSDIEVDLCSVDEFIRRYL